MAVVVVDSGPDIGHGGKESGDGADVSGVNGGDMVLAIDRDSGESGVGAHISHGTVSDSGDCDSACHGFVGDIVHSGSHSHGESGVGAHVQM